MIITSRKDHYKGLLNISLPTTIRNHTRYFTCDCGCSFFRETSKLNMYRCNSCKVWHRILPRDFDADEAFRQMIRQATDTKHQLRLSALGLIDPPKFLTTIKPRSNYNKPLTGDVSEGIFPIQYNYGRRLELKSLE